MLSDFWMGYLLGCITIGIISGAIATYYADRITTCEDVYPGNMQVSNKPTTPEPKDN